MKISNCGNWIDSGRAEFNVDLPKQSELMVVF
jgi:hypothetical protein